MIRDVRHAVPALAFALLAAGAGAAPQAESPAGAPRSVRSAAVAARPAARPRTGLPPLLDRELFFGNPEIAAAQLSPDGKYIAFLKPWKDTRNIYVKKTREPFEKARLLTTEAKRPIPAFFWTRDSRLVLYVRDNDGDENYNVWAVDPAAANAEGKDAPASRNITDVKGARAFIYALPKNLPDTMYVGLNDRDAAWHDLYRVEISTGKRDLMRKNTERIAGWLFDLDGRLRMAVRVADNGDTDLLRVDHDAFTRVYSCSVLESCGPERFHKDGRLYLQTNKGDADLTTLVLLDPASGKVEPVESDPLKRVDFGGAVFSEASEELVATTYEDERTRVYFKDAVWKADYARLRRSSPARTSTSAR